MRVEYIQPVCPYCNRGLYFQTISNDTAHYYFCPEHGDIEARLVRYVRCEQMDGVMMPPAPYETYTDECVP